MTVRRIISGGQTGADQAGLFAARDLGLRTGGWAPKGFWTDNGYAQELLESFGLVECPQSGYPPRTRLNVRDSDGTLIFGNANSPGCRLTRKYCDELERTVMFVPWYGTVDVRSYLQSLFRQWITDKNIQTLNVAGNRERTNPGIFAAARAFLVEALGEQ